MWFSIGVFHVFHVSLIWFLNLLHRKISYVANLGTIFRKHGTHERRQFIDQILLTRCNILKEFFSFTQKIGFKGTAGRQKSSYFSPMKYFGFNAICSVDIYFKFATPPHFHVRNHFVSITMQIFPLI